MSIDMLKIIIELHYLYQARQVNDFPLPAHQPGAIYLYLYMVSCECGHYYTMLVHSFFLQIKKNITTP